MPVQHMQTVYAQLCERGRELLQMLAIGFFVGQIFGQTLGTIVALCFLPHPISVLFLALQVSLHKTGSGSSWQPSQPSW